MLRLTDRIERAVISDINIHKCFSRARVFCSQIVANSKFRIVLAPVSSRRKKLSKNINEKLIFCLLLGATYTPARGLKIDKCTYTGFLFDFLFIAG